MNIRTQRKRFLALADQLKKNIPLNEAQKSYLSECFFHIGNGVDPALALGLAYTTGHNEKNDIALEERSLIIGWMTHAMQPIINDETGNRTNLGGYGFNLEQALDAALQLMDGKWLNPITNEMHEYKNQNGELTSAFLGKKYSEDTLRKLWRESENSHMKNLYISPTDKDSFLDF